MLTRGIMGTILQKQSTIHIFLINPVSGGYRLGQQLREKLACIPDLQYFVFTTRYAGYEKEVIKKIQNIFEGEKLRFYCCGGSGTMRNMLNGFEDLSKEEIAFFPCGLTNDFLKIFGEDRKKFEEIEKLIDGDVIDVDYIKSNHGIALNTLSVGIDSELLKKFDDMRVFQILSPSLPYTLGAIYAAFFSKFNELEVEVDGKQLEGKLLEVFFGNGNVYGGNIFMFQEAQVTDGLAQYRVFQERYGFGILSLLSSLQHKKFGIADKISEFGKAKKIVIRRKDRQALTMNLDGELIEGSNQWEAEIVKKGLHLVVPKGVEL